MKHILILLITLSATYLHAQDTDTDSIAMNAIHTQAMPELLNENQKLQEAKAQIDLALKNNTEKIMLIITAYSDPKRFTGQFTKDMKIIVKK